MAFYKLTFSPTGRTQAVADILGYRFGKNPVCVDLSKPDVDVANLQLSKKDFVLVSVPCYGGRVPALATQRLQGLQANGSLCVLAVVYGNRAFDDALIELYDIMTAAGLRCIAGVAAVAEHSIFRTFASQRPGEGDTMQLLDFARQIVARVREGVADLELEVPGERPYKEMPEFTLKPHAEENCTGCGTCAKQCPAQAIPASHPIETDEEVCIACQRCVEVCPHGVRKVGLLARTQAYRMLQGPCSTPKENQLFLAEHRPQQSEGTEDVTEDAE